MDSWKPEHIKAMFYGGNKKAKEAFKSQGWNNSGSQDFDQKYRCAAATKYHKVLYKLVNACDMPIEEVLNSGVKSALPKKLSASELGGDRGLDNLIRESTPPPAREASPALSSFSEPLVARVQTPSPTRRAERPDSVSVKVSERQPRPSSSTVGPDSTISCSSDSTPSTISTPQATTTPELVAKDMTGLMLGPEVVAGASKPVNVIKRRPPMKKKNGLGAIKAGSKATVARSSNVVSAISTTGGGSKYSGKSTLEEPTPSVPTTNWSSTKANDDPDTSKAALDKMKYSKGISSDTFFNKDASSQNEIESARTKFSSSAGISSDAYFGRTDPEEESRYDRSYSASSTDLSSATDFFNELGSKIKSDVANLAAKYRN